MRLIVQVKMDNAFERENQFLIRREAARILRQLAKRIDDHPHFSTGHDQALHDANGNSVGFAGVYEGSEFTFIVR